MKNFALIGAAGFVAPRHMKAIKETGNRLVVALDNNDSVGIIDSYFPDADFFTEFERFDRHIELIKRNDPDKAVNYVSICSPNYLHDSHIRFSLRAGAHAICEKPLVLTPWNIDGLSAVEKDQDKRIYNILQLRHHPTILALKKEIDEGPADKIYDIDLAYITSRGKWYQYSWKGIEEKSGGVATNIGVHFFDMLMWIFGEPTKNQVNLFDPYRAAGYLELKKARVRWYLSIDANDLPKEATDKDMRTFRSITIEGKEMEFSGGFTDLHTLSYQAILDGQGFGLEEARNSIDLVYAIRKAKPIGLKEEYHPFCQR